MRQLVWERWTYWFCSAGKEGGGDSALLPTSLQPLARVLNPRLSDLVTCSVSVDTRVAYKIFSPWLFLSLTSRPNLSLSLILPLFLSHSSFLSLSFTLLSFLFLTHSLHFFFLSLSSLPLLLSFSLSPFHDPYCHATVSTRSMHVLKPGKRQEKRP